jgi:hypothetical protein
VSTVPGFETFSTVTVNIRLSPPSLFMPTMNCEAISSTSSIDRAGSKALGNGLVVLSTLK